MFKKEKEGIGELDAFEQALFAEFDPNIQAMLSEESLSKFFHSTQSSFEESFVKISPRYCADEKSRFLNKFSV